MLSATPKFSLANYLETRIALLEAHLKGEAQKERYHGAVAVLGAFRGIALSSLN